MQVDLSANIVSELPETFTKLRNLKVNSNLLLFYDKDSNDKCFGVLQTLELNNTGLKTLPLGLFNMCLQLSTLGLHNTEITVEFLRQVFFFFFSAVSCVFEFFSK